MKRGFLTERDADKALGRARAKRHRRADAAGTRRGQHIEQRYYQCDYGMFHLTSQNRSDYEGRASHENKMRIEVAK
ncbi:hypothetical protein ACFYWP_01465 [Actinacidiphila glaucinigra]|uniref:hypothetical protein n=1 Tax=Actinacidiphila glaucinigra TaxID=235986 RepID=UPI0036A8B720